MGGATLPLYFAQHYRDASIRSWNRRRLWLTSRYAFLAAFEARCRLSIYGGRILTSLPTRTLRRYLRRCHVVDDHPVRCRRHRRRFEVVLRSTICASGCGRASSFSMSSAATCTCATSAPRTRLQARPSAGCCAVAPHYGRQRRPRRRCRWSFTSRRELREHVSSFGARDGGRRTCGMAAGMCITRSGRGAVRLRVTGLSTLVRNLPRKEYLINETNKNKQKAPR